MPNDVVEVGLRGLMPTNNGAAVFLGNEEKCFVIYIDPHVGHSLQLTIAGQKRERPLTHDLIGNLLLGLGVELVRVVVNDMRDGTFFARIILRQANEVAQKLVEVDARPSDSIVLALQQKRPLFVARTVFEQAEDMTSVLENVRRQQRGLGDVGDETGEGPPDEGEDDDPPPGPPSA